MNKLSSEETNQAQAKKSTFGQMNIKSTTKDQPFEKRKMEALRKHEARLERKELDDMIDDCLETG